MTIPEYPDFTMTVATDITVRRTDSDEPIAFPNKIAVQGDTIINGQPAAAVVLVSKHLVADTDPCAIAQPKLAKALAEFKAKHEAA